MKKTITLSFIFVLLGVATSLLFAQPIPNDSLYLGQTPPGNSPKIFNLPVTGGHRPCERIAITSDGKEIYYGELNTYPPSSYRIRCFRYLDNKWQGPFNIFEGYTAPKLSINDSILYMQNNIFYTYFSIRTDSGWSIPVRFLSNNQRMHYFQRTNLNNSYASSYYEGSPTDGDLCKLIAVNQDTILQSLGIPLNSPLQENDFFIAADESYILFSKNVTGGAGDIYLSFQKGNGRWTNPKKLGATINKSGNSWEYGHFVTKDNKYLFYTSGGLTMNSYYTYWVKIDNIIDSLRHTNFAPYINYQIPNQSIKVGSVFNYTVPDSTFVDDDGNSTLTYSAEQIYGSPLPGWLSFDTLSKTFSGNPTGASIVSVKLSAKDSANVIIPCMFDITITAVNGIENSEGKIPISINVLQNYPNPFNPTTTIEFAIPKTGKYSLNLYNILGELVKEITNKEYEAGYYKEIFNAAGFASGMYVCRLAGHETNIVRKMILLR